VWSPDGSKIAFTSDRYGNFDVYSMPASGGTATRLTFHSANDFPTSFAPDGESVLFSSARLDSKDCVQFPTGAQPELYRVLLTGGMPAQVLTTPASFAVYDQSSQRLAYSDEKSYEDEWRKHDNSSFARDVWLYDVEAGQHTRLTDFGADDRQPVWAPGEESIYYLSERDGTFNVWRLALASPGPVRSMCAQTEHRRTARSRSL
jgi:tricorn protease